MSATGAIYPQVNEAFGLDDASAAEIVNDLEIFTVDAESLDNMYYPGCFQVDDHPFPKNVLDQSHQQDLTGREPSNDSTASDVQSTQHSTNQPMLSQTSGTQYPMSEHHGGQDSIEQMPTKQPFEQQAEPTHLPSNNGMYLGTTSSTPSPYLLGDHARDTSQHQTGFAVPSQGASEHQPNMGNFPLSNLANDFSHSHQLVQFYDQQPRHSQWLGTFNSRQWAIPSQTSGTSQSWRSNNYFDPEKVHDFHKRQQTWPGASPQAPAFLHHDDVQDEAEGAARCGKSGRKPAGRKGAPKPKTYSEVEEAIILEGVLEGASFREIAEELGRPGQAVEHKIRRMKALGNL